MKLTAWLAALAVVAVGCQQTPAPASSNTPEKPEAVASTPNAEANATPSQPGTDNRTMPPVSEEGPAVPDPKVEPGAPPSPKGGDKPAPGGSTPPVGSKVQWTKPKIDPMEIARRLDEAMYEMEQASGKVRLIMERSGGRGSDEGMVEIQSANRYNIDWFRTDKFGMIFKSRANGKVRRELQDQGWGPISPLPATWTKDEALTDEWSTFFPKLIFRPVIEKKPIWVPLISSLRKQGYTVALGSRNAELPDGRTRVLYQFECTSKNPKHFQITARFDGQRLVPLTVNLKRGATTYRWTAEWAFNQKVDDKMFEIVETPVNAESPKTP